MRGLREFVVFSRPGDLKDHGVAVASYISFNRLMCSTLCM